MTPEATLRRWIRDHRVCWEVSSLQEVNQQGRVAVGYELHLFARHAAGVRANPGCSECRDLHEKLRAIAVFVLPREHRPTRYEIAPFDASFHLRPESEWVPEVQLTLEIVHRQGYLRPIDECELRCAREIEDRLHALGAPSRAWSEGRNASQSTRRLIPDGKEDPQ